MQQIWHLMNITKPKFSPGVQAYPAVPPPILFSKSAPDMLPSLLRRRASSSHHFVSFRISFRSFRFLQQPWFRWILDLLRNKSKGGSMLKFTPPTAGGERAGLVTCFMGRVQRLAQLCLYTCRRLCSLSSAAIARSVRVHISISFE